MLLMRVGVDTSKPRSRAELRKQCQRWGEKKALHPLTSSMLPSCVLQDYKSPKAGRAYNSGFDYPRTVALAKGANDAVNIVAMWWFQLPMYLDEGSFFIQSKTFDILPDLVDSHAKR